MPGKGSAKYPGCGSAECPREFRDAWDVGVPKASEVCAEGIPRDASWGTRCPTRECKCRKPQRFVPRGMPRDASWDARCPKCGGPDARRCVPEVPRNAMWVVSDKMWDAITGHGKEKCGDPI